MQERISKKLKEIDKEYTELQEGIEQYQNNNIPSADLKKKGSKFGIYEQKGKTMMLRLKAVGGELSVKRFKDLVEIMEKYEIPHLHLSTRQNYQLHEVKFENVKDVIEACNHHEMYFRGGGGNTFRSILISSYTGVAKREIFDVMPYARMVENEVFFYDKAFEFGRKLKMGLISDSSQEFVMAVQDLGFVAREINGKRGFRVYCGGGMGRNSKLGYVLMDFLPEEELLKAVMAIIDIFYEHGNRENRMKARLRFLVEEMGFEAFRNMFEDYFKKSQVVNGNMSPMNYEKKVALLKKFEKKTSTPAFEAWKRVCAKETKFKDVVSLELFVKNGNLELAKVIKLQKLLEDIGASLIRANINQNIVIPLVHVSALGYIYDYLNKEIPNIVTDILTVDGQIRACVGSTICMIGIQDSMKIADAVARELNALALEYPAYREVIFKEAKNVRISGCPSSCAGVPVAPLGFIGLKKRIGDEIKDCMQVYKGGMLGEDIQALAVEEAGNVVLVEDMPDYVKEIFRDYIKSLKHDNVSFARYMYNRRPKD